MLDDILDLFNRDRHRQRRDAGIRGLLDRLGDHDDDRPATRPHHRRHDEDWDADDLDHDDHHPRQASGRHRREQSDWFD